MSPSTPSAQPPRRPSLVELVAQAVLDAELAALVWVLVEGKVPLVVAAPAGRGGAGGQLLAGVLESIRPDVPIDPLVSPLTAAGASNLVRGRRAGGMIEAASLEEVRSRLGSGPLPLGEDQLTFLGCVLVLGDLAEGPGGRRGRLRVTAAHYVRPLARDAHGHSQRLDPAVLATWDERLGRYEHFAWGVLPEIASRLGRRAGDLEADLHHRRDDLAGLAKAGVTKLDEVQRLIAGYQVRYGVGHGKGDGTSGGHVDGAGHEQGDGAARGHGSSDGHGHGAEDGHSADHGHGAGDTHVAGDGHGAPTATGPPGHAPHDDHDHGHDGVHERGAEPEHDQGHEHDQRPN